MRPTLFQQKVYNVVKRIPRGKVTTYVAVARALHSPRAARAVGNALRENPLKSVPCHRVVRSDGQVGGFAQGIAEKAKILQIEGVKIIRGRVDPQYIARSM